MVRISLLFVINSSWLFCKHRFVATAYFAANVVMMFLMNLWKYTRDLVKSTIELGDPAWSVLRHMAELTLVLIIQDRLKYQ